MRKSLLVISLLLLWGMTFGQLSGTKTIPGDYPTIAAAITALNTAGVGGGGVTFNVAAGHTETFTSLTSGLITATGTSSNPIIFQKSGTGANPKITAATPGATTDRDYIICLSGTDYITFNSIDLQENPNNLTPTTQMEWGYAILKSSATNGSQNVILTGCNITLNKSNTASKGIYGGNHLSTSTTALTITSLSGINSNIIINSCNVSNAYIPINIAGSSAATYYDTGLEIGSTIGNIITNYGGGSSTTYGIYINGQSSPKIENNNVTLGLGTTTTAYGINVAANCSGDLLINANTVSVSSSATTSQLCAINNLAPINSIVTISNNVIQNCAFTTATSGNFIGIYEQAATIGSTVNITGNTINGLNYSATTLSGSGTVYGIYKTSGTPSIVNCNNNSVYGFTIYGSTGGTFYGIYLNAGSSVIVNKNNIYDHSINGTGSSGTIYGIRTSNTTVTNNSNNIYNLSNNKTTGTAAIYGIYNLSSPTNENFNLNNVYALTHAGSGTVAGIYLNTATGTRNVSENNIHTLSSGGTVYGLYQASSSPNIFKNNIYNLVTNGTGGSCYGIYISSGTTIKLFNNYVSDLRAPSLNAAISLAGIYLASGTTCSVYYNTVYLNASSTGALFGSAALYASTSPTLDLRNNILINLSIPAGALGFTAAYRRSSATLTTYSALSNNNNFYAGTPGPGNVIFYDGANSDQTMAAYQARVAPRDDNSFTENSPFVNVATPPYDLHLSTSYPYIATQCESGGVPIATITEDFDGNKRYPNPGYPENSLYPATAPDVGADEFAGRPNYTCQAPSPGNTLASANPICLGQSVTLTLQNPPTGTTGNAYQWQSSLDGYNFSNIQNATNSSLVVTPTQSTWYQCIVTCQNGPITVYSNPIQIEFSNNITSITPNFRCGIGTVQLQATASSGTIKWYDVASGGSSIGSGSPFTTPVINASTTYYVAAELSSPGGTITLGAGASTSTGYQGPFYYLYGGSKSQYLIPASELLAAGMSAGNLTSLAFDITSTGTTFNDFNLSIGTTAQTALTTTFTTGLTSVYSTSAITPTLGLFYIPFTTPFYWDGISNVVIETCWSNNNGGGSPHSHVKYDATAYVATAYQRADNQTAGVFCANTTAYWTYSSRPKIVLNVTPMCSSSRVPVLATVNQPPDLSVTANQTVCNNQVATIAVTSPLANYDTYTWSPVDYLFTDPACTVPYVTLTNASTVYAKTTTATTITYSCYGSNATSLCNNLAGTTITVLPATVAINASPAEICYSGSSVLSLNPSSGYGEGTFQWQDSPDNVTFTDIIGATGTSYTTPVLTTTTYYKAIIRNGSGAVCLSPQYTLIVNHPSITGTTPGSRCGIGTVTLGATGTDGTVTWYASPEGGVPLGTGPTFITPVISSSTNFYVASEVSCGSGSFAIGSGASTSSGSESPFYYLWGGQKTQFLIKASELLASGLTAGNLSALAFEIVSASETFNGFEIQIGNTNLNSLTTTLVSGLSSVFSVSSITPTAGVFTIPFNIPFYWDGTSNIIIQTCWSNNDDGLKTGSTVKYDATSFVATAYYRADNMTPGVLCATNIGSGTYSTRPKMILTGPILCSSLRTAVLATVLPPPALTITPDLTICNNSVASLSVTSTLTDYTSYSWSPATYLFTDPACTIPYIEMTNASTVYARTTTPTTITYTCTGENSASLCRNIAQTSVTIVPANPLIQASPQYICSSGSATLSVSPASGWGNATFQWQESSDNVNFVNIATATGTTYTTPVVTSTTYYKLLMSNSAGTVCSAPQYTLVVNNPLFVSATPGSRCGFGTVTLQAAVTGGVPRWYSTQTGGEMLGTGNQFVTPVIYSTTTFYVGAEVGYYIGQGSTTSTGAVSPFYHLDGGKKTQYLILASELTAAGITAGNINSIGFQMTSGGQTYNGFNFSIGNTSLTSLTTTFVTGLTNVYSAASLTTSSGLFYIDFGTPYYWDGISNLVIETCWSNNNGGDTSLSSHLKYDNTGFATTLYKSADNQTPEAICSGETGSTLNQRPRILFNGSQLCAGTRTAVVATVTPAPEVTPTASPVNVCAGAPATLNVTSVNPGYTYTWMPGNLVGATQTVNPTVTTYYTVTAQDGVTGCATMGTVSVTVMTTPSPITITPPSAAILPGSIQPLSASGGLVQGVVLLAEDFNAPTNAWTTINNSTGGTPANAAWTLRPDGYYYDYTFHSNDNSQFYLSNSDEQGSGGTTETILQSPAFSTLGFTDVNLSFYHYYNHFVGDYAYVDFSTDGTTWTNLLTYSSDIGTSSAFVNGTVALPGAFINQPVVYVRFKYSASFDYYWAIDNVSVTGNGSVGITWSPLTALYTDPAATVPYTGTVTSTVYAKPAVTTTYTATSIFPGTQCNSSQNVTVSVFNEPAVTTGPVTPSYYSATGGGIVTSAGGGNILARGVCWSLNPNPTLADNFTTDGTGLGSFVSNLTPLLPNMPYHVRAYATNEVATSYGQDILFTTLNPCLPPTLLTATNITQTGADLNWTEAGAATSWDLEWGPAGFTQGNGTMVTGLTTKPYILTNLPTNSKYDFYVRSNCGQGVYTAWSGPKQFDLVPLPTISGATEVCFGADAAIYFTETGKTNYQWTVSVGGVVVFGGGPTDDLIMILWTNAGAQSVSVNYKNSAGVAAPVPTVLPVTVFQPFVAGTITANQIICAGTIPALLTGTAPTGGDVPYIYQWQESTDGTTFQDIAGATDLNYQPGSLTMTTYYRMKQTSYSNCGFVYTNVVTITMYGPLVAGTITPDQAICYREDPPDMLTGTAPTGGAAPYSYQWEISADGNNFTEISGATGLTYQPNVLTETTYYRMKQTSSGGCGFVYTNILTVVVYPSISAGTIAADQSVCYNTAPAPLTGTPPTGGNPPYSYQWAYSENGMMFIDIPGATNLNYSPGALTTSTYFIMTQTSSSGCGTVSTNMVTITVLPTFAAGSIAADQTIASGATPAPLTGVAPTGGLTPYGYQWQNSANGVNFVDIPGATNLGYAPGPLTVTTWYRARQSSAGNCGSGLTNIVKITVSSLPVNLTVQNVTVSDGQTYCYDALETITVAGSGTYFTVNNGGSATFIAGQKITYLPGTKVNPGGYMHGYISNEFCPVIPPAITNAQQTASPVNGMLTFRLYPNPTSGRFTVQQVGDQLADEVMVEVYTMLGERILTDQMTGVKKHEFVLPDLPAGIYVVKIQAGETMETVKLIRQ